jgi:hypothetical protein
MEFRRGKTGGTGSTLGIKEIGLEQLPLRQAQGYWVLARTACIALCFPFVGIKN